MTDPTLSVTIIDGSLLVEGQIEAGILVALQREVYNRGRAKNSRGSATRMLPVRIRIYPSGILVNGPIEARVFNLICAPEVEKNGWTSFLRAARKIGVNILLTNRDHVANVATSSATP